MKTGFLPLENRHSLISLSKVYNLNQTPLNPRGRGGSGLRMSMGAIAKTPDESRDVDVVEVRVTCEFFYH